MVIFSSQQFSLGPLFGTNNMNIYIIITFMNHNSIMYLYIYVWKYCSAIMCIHDSHILYSPIPSKSLIKMSLTAAPLGRQRTGPNLLASTAVAGYNGRGRCSRLGGWDTSSSGVRHSVPIIILIWTKTTVSMKQSPNILMHRFCW